MIFNLLNSNYRQFDICLLLQNTVHCVVDLWEQFCFLLLMFLKKSNVITHDIDFKNTV